MFLSCWWRWYLVLNVTTVVSGGCKQLQYFVGPPSPRDIRPFHCTHNKNSMNSNSKNFNSTYSKFPPNTSSLFKTPKLEISSQVDQINLTAVHTFDPHCIAAYSNYSFAWISITLFIQPYQAICSSPQSLFIRCGIFK